MASYSQIRLQQLTGSIVDVAYSGSVAGTAQAGAIVDADLGSLLGEIAGAIGRISGKNAGDGGANSFTNQAAGVFTHTNTDFGGAGDAFRINDNSGVVTLKALANDGDMLFNVNDGGADSEIFRLDADVSALLLASGKQLQIGGAARHITDAGDDIVVTSGADLLLSASADIRIPKNVGLVFSTDNAEKIESDDTNLTVTSGVDIILDPAGDVVISGTSQKLEFGSAGSGEHILGDGNDLTVASGRDVILDATSKVTLDGDLSVALADGGSQYLQFTRDGSGNAVLSSSVHTKDILVHADGGSLLATFDGSAKALELQGTNKLHFNDSGTAINSPSDGKLLLSSDGATDDAIEVKTTNAAGEIVLESAHTAGRAIYINANANAGSIFDIDAGILDIDVQGLATLDSVGFELTAGSGEIDLTTTGQVDINWGAAGGIFAGSGPAVLDSTSTAVILSGAIGVALSGSGVAGVSFSGDGNMTSGLLGKGMAFAKGHDEFRNFRSVDLFDAGTSVIGALTALAGAAGGGIIARRRVPATTAANSDVTLNSLDDSSLGYASAVSTVNADVGNFELYLNGQLLSSGSSAPGSAVTGGDYIIKTLTSPGVVKFAFKLEPDDLVVVKTTAAQ